MTQTEATNKATSRQDAADYIFSILRELEKLARSNDMIMLSNMLSLSRDEARKYITKS